MCPECGKNECPYWCALNDDPYASQGRNVRVAKKTLEEGGVLSQGRSARGRKKTLDEEER